MVPFCRPELTVTLADITLTGYPLTQFCIWPFSEHDLTNDEEEAAAKWHWNCEVSALHVTVEHAFGTLKT